MSVHSKMKVHKKRFRQELFFASGGTVFFIGAVEFTGGIPWIRAFGLVFLGIALIFIGALE